MKRVGLVTEKRGYFVATPTTVKRSINENPVKVREAREKIAKGDKNTEKKD